MIRIFYSICFLVFGMGLPLLAKNAGIDRPTPSTSSKAGSKAIPTSTPAVVARAKAQSDKKNVVTVTPDVARGSVSPSLLTKQQALVARQEADPQVATFAPAPPHRPGPREDPSSSSASSPVIRRSTIMTYSDGSATPLRTASGPVTTESDSDHGDSGQRLARVTAYWAAEGDYYTERCISSTGVRLHDGHCAVDPNIIPYGSVVEIAGVGKFLAVDTGSAVINRTAAREGGHTDAERHAIVVDLFFEDRSEGEKFAADAAKYVSISWWTPTAMGIEAKAARGLFAEEDWTKIQGKQL
jgi:3D (Asp-Asp-Asp) domain-containing protein